ncbi:hypothetical protein SLOPH_882, partial [Spraguea lophii 42_110]
NKNDTNILSNSINNLSITNNTNNDITNKYINKLVDRLLSHKKYYELSIVEKERNNNIESIKYLILNKSYYEIIIEYEDIREEVYKYYKNNKIISNSNDICDSNNNDNNDNKVICDNDTNTYNTNTNTYNNNTNTNIDNISEICKTFITALEDTVTVRYEEIKKICKKIISYYNYHYNDGIMDDESTATSIISSNTSKSFRTKKISKYNIKFEEYMKNNNNLITLLQNIEHRMYKNIIEEINKVYKYVEEIEQYE